MTELIINEALNTFPFLFVGYLPAQESLRFSKRRTLLRTVLWECGYLCIFGLLVKFGFSAVYVQYLAAPLFLVLMMLNFRTYKWIILFHFIFTIDYLLAIRAATFFLCENNIAFDFYSWQAGLVTLVMTLSTLIPMSTFLHEILKTRIMESRRTRHDFRHHRMVLKELADRNDLHGIRTYLAEYNAEHVDTPSKTYSNNPTVNAVVAYYAGHAEAAGIRFTARVQLPEHLLIPDPIFCVLLGNLLENAVDACKTELSQSASSGAASADANAGGPVTGAEAAEAEADSSTAAGTAIDPRAGVTASADIRSDQAIRVIVKQNGDACLSIAVDNTCSRKPIWDDGELVSTKHVGHGVGTVSIRYIAHRYDGDARFEWRDGIFYASVMLNPQSPPNP